MGRPCVAVQHAVVVGEVAGLTETHDPQRRSDRPPTGHEDRPHHKHQHVLPGRGGEAVPEGLQKAHQAVRHAVPGCASHASLPEPMARETRQAQVRCESRRLSRRIQVTHDSTGLDAASQGAGQRWHIAAKPLSTASPRTLKLAKVELSWTVKAYRCGPCRGSWLRASRSALQYV